MTAFVKPMHTQIMARHAAEDAENMVDDEVPAVVEDMRRKRRDAEPVVIPTHANVLPTTYHHLAGAYPIYQTSVYNPYLSYPLHQVQPVSSVFSTWVNYIKIFVLPDFFPI